MWLEACGPYGQSSSQAQRPHFQCSSVKPSTVDISLCRWLQVLLIMIFMLPCFLRTFLQNYSSNHPLTHQFSKLSNSKEKSRIDGKVLKWELSWSLSWGVRSSPTQTLHSCPERPSESCSETLCASLTLTTQPVGFPACRWHLIVTQDRHDTEN